MRCLFLMLLLGSIPFLLAEEVRLVDLDPPEAQQIIDQHDVSLNYAPKIDANVPAVRYLGEEPHHVLEDVYLAKQYHGQDGLGGYLYGYNVPDIAKTERKKAGGDLRGAYNYIAGNGQEIKVEYWDDGTGFHQIDNVPKILPKQIDDLPEVQAEKDKFLARWHEEAERNSRPVANPYNDEGQYANGPLSAQGQLEAKLQLQQQPNLYQASSQYQYGQYQQEKQNNQQPTQYQAGQYQQPGQYQATGQYQKSQESQSSGQYQQPGQYQATGQYQKPQESQSTGQYQATGQYQKPQSQQTGQYQATGQYQKPQSQVTGQYEETGQYQKPQESQSTGQYQATGQYQKPQSQETGQYQATGQYQKPQSQITGQYQETGQYQKPQESQYTGQYQETGQYQKPQNQDNGQYQANGQYQKPQSQENGQYQATGQYQKPQESQYTGQYQATGQYQQPGLNQIDYSGQYSENQNVYSSLAQSSSSGNGKGNEIDNSGKYVKTDDEESTGPPKGFFYSFDYPVGIIVQKGDLVRNGEVKNVYDENKAKFESQLRSGKSNGSSQSGYLYVKN